MRIDGRLALRLTFAPSVDDETPHPRTGRT
jgi:hypothetical protein